MSCFESIKSFNVIASLGPANHSDAGSDRVIGLSSISAGLVDAKLMGTMWSIRMDALLGTQGYTHKGTNTRMHTQGCTNEA